MDDYPPAENTVTRTNIGPMADSTHSRREALTTDRP